MYRYFLSKLKTSESRFRYILNVPISEVSNIFAKDVNSELLIQILKVFAEVIADRLVMKQEQMENESVEETKAGDDNDTALFSFIGDFITLIAKSEGFDFCVCFLGDAEKQTISEICNGLAEFGYTEVEAIKTAFELPA